MREEGIEGKKLKQKRRGTGKERVREGYRERCRESKEAQSTGGRQSEKRKKHNGNTIGQLLDKEQTRLVWACAACGGCSGMMMGIGIEVYKCIQAPGTGR